MIDPALRDLYQEVLLDHGRSPRHFGKLTDPTHEAHGHNPLCGDRVHLTLKLDPGGQVEDIMFNGKGCAISMASASIMSDLLRGKPVERALALAGAFYRMAKGETVEAGVEAEDLERLEVMSGVSEFPMRVKCATLAWHTFEEAVEPQAGGDTETDAR